MLATDCGLLLVAEIKWQFIKALACVLYAV